MSGFDVPTNPVVEVEIEVRAGPSVGRRFALRRFPLVVGRGQDVDVQLEDDMSDPTISRRHLRIQLESGHVRVSDVSTNGTWIGGRQLAPGESVVVTSADAIWLGPRTMIVVRSLADAPPVLPPPLPVRAASAVPAAAEAAHTLRIEALGPNLVTLGPHVIPESAWQTRKALVLLTCLADHAPRAVPADRLEELLWPHAPESARQALQTVVSRVRKAFRGLGADLPDPIRLERLGYVLAPDMALDYDVQRLEQAWEEAARVRGTAAAEAALEKAWAACGGDFLEGSTDDWAAARRRALQVRHFETAEALAALREARGAPHDAIYLYQQIVERDPCRESSQAGLVRALAASGRRDEAARAYRDATRALQRMLGLPPSVALVEAYESARR